MDKPIELIVGKYYTTTWAKKNASWELVDFISVDRVKLKNRWSKKIFEAKVHDLLDIAEQPEPFIPEPHMKMLVYHPKYGWVKK